MNIPLPQYRKIRNKYCICYLGRSAEYMVQLLLLRKNMKVTYPEIDVYLSCSEELFPVIEDHADTIRADALRNANIFSYVYNMKCNLLTHPVEEFMEESGVPLEVSAAAEGGDDRGVIVPEGVIPTKSLTPNQIAECERYARSRGYRPQVGGDAAGAGLVIGVENEALFRAAGAGTRTALVPTGLGTNLYRKMFKQGEVLRAAV